MKIQASETGLPNTVDVIAGDVTADEIKEAASLIKRNHWAARIKGHHGAFFEELQNPYMRFGFKQHNGLLYCSWLDIEGVSSTENMTKTYYNEWKIYKSDKYANKRLMQLSDGSMLVYLADRVVCRKHDLTAYFKKLDTKKLFAITLRDQLVDSYSRPKILVDVLLASRPTKDNPNNRIVLLSELTHLD